MNDSKKVLVLGAKGMLGQELVRVFGLGEAYTVTAWDVEDIDVTNFELLKTKIGELAPEVILNVVAYNSVDQCETDEKEYVKARLLNSEVPKKLAQISQKLECTLVHYSTDYVFDGSLETGYDEEAHPSPLSRYGETKLSGEQAVQASGAKAYVIRLSKLFGRRAASVLGKRSFFEIMLEKGRSLPEIQVVDDERSCFTYAPDLAQATRELIESQAIHGLYHLPNEGAATWYEGAVELFRQAGLATNVVPVSGSVFPRPARRPATSILINTRRPKLRSYQEALAEYLHYGG